jgi:hypothetical protein
LVNTLFLLGLLPNGLFDTKLDVLSKIFKTNFDVYLKGKRGRQGEIFLEILPKKLFLDKNAIWQQTYDIVYRK